MSEYETYWYIQGKSIMCNNIKELQNGVKEGDIVKRLVQLHGTIASDMPYIGKVVEDAAIYITKLRLDLISGQKGKNG